MNNQRGRVPFQLLPAIDIWTEEFPELKGIPPNGIQRFEEGILAQIRTRRRDNFINSIERKVQETKRYYHIALEVRFYNLPEESQKKL